MYGLCRPTLVYIGPVDKFIRPNGTERSNVDVETAVLSYHPGGVRDVTCLYGLRNIGLYWSCRQVHNS